MPSLQVGAYGPRDPRVTAALQHTDHAPISAVKGLYGKFYVVVGLGQGAPSVVHFTYAAAEAEAKRLAALEPGTTFVVMGSTKGYRKTAIEEITF